MPLDASVDSRSSPRGRALLVLAPLAVAVGLAGCGGNDHAAGGKPRTPESVKACLEDGGFKVQGDSHDLPEREPGMPNDDADAPDVGVLYVTRPPEHDYLSIIGFYSSDSRAEEISSDLRSNAKRLNGTIARHGSATAMYLRTEVPSTATPAKPDQRIERCL